MEVFYEDLARSNTVAHLSQLQLWVLRCRIWVSVLSHRRFSHRRSVPSCHHTEGLPKIHSNCDSHNDHDPMHVADSSAGKARYMAIHIGNHGFSCKATLVLKQSDPLLGQAIPPRCKFHLFWYHQSHCAVTRIVPTPHLACHHLLPIVGGQGLRY
jgi:hypothetical protein